jgi:hypothetical protein
MQPPPITRQVGDKEFLPLGHTARVRIGRTTIMNAPFSVKQTG